MKRTNDKYYDFSIHTHPLTIANTELCKQKFCYQAQFVESILLVGHLCLVGSCFIGSVYQRNKSAGKRSCYCYCVSEEVMFDLLIIECLSTTDPTSNIFSELIY